MSGRWKRKAFCPVCILINTQGLQRSVDRLNLTHSAKFFIKTRCITYSDLDYMFVKPDFPYWQYAFYSNVVSLWTETYICAIGCARRNAIVDTLIQDGLTVLDKTTFGGNGSGMSPPKRSRWRDLIRKGLL